MARLVLVVVPVVAAGLAAAQENHVTVDTDGGRIVIRTGYDPAESEFSIGPDGWMRRGDQILTRESFSSWPGDQFTGWQAGAETVLTSDWFAPTGRLDGGDFYYEIVGFEAAWGTRASDFAWVEADGLVIEWFGRAGAATRVDRSFHVGFSGHSHGQVWMAEKPGLYELTLLAWDANGVYADSAPVRMRIRSVPSPGVLAILGMACILPTRRR